MPSVGGIGVGDDDRDADVFTRDEPFRGDFHKLWGGRSLKRCFCVRSFGFGAGAAAWAGG